MTLYHPVTNEPASIEECYAYALSQWEAAVKKNEQTPMSYEKHMTRAHTRQQLEYFATLLGVEPPPDPQHPKLPPAKVYYNVNLNPDRKP